MRDPKHQRQARLFLPLVVLGSVCMFLAATLSVVPATSAQSVEPTPLPLYALPDARFNRSYNSGSMALSNDGRMLVAANMLNGTISVVNVIAPTAAKLEAEIAVGKDPRSVALLPDNVHALVTNHGDGTLAVVDIVEGTLVDTIPLGGSLPYAVVTDRNDLAYVSMIGSDEVLVVSLTGEGVLERIPVDARPAGLALWGDFLYVTHFWSGDVSLVYLPQARVTAQVSSGPDTTALQAIELDITRGIAYFPQTRSNTRNANLTFDTVVFPVVNVMDLNSLTLLPESRITLDTA
ncbi:MAG: YncE family protein, partial [Anaerolineae bacterium]|nr:YncE family protein [Anaerolineae bacterium]